MRYIQILGFITILTISSQSVAADPAAGKKIFEQSCAYCHKTNYDEKFGPGLAGISERRDVKWLDAFLLNPAKMVAEDEYARGLKEDNKYGLSMPALPEMRDDKKRQDVIEYLKTLQ